MAAKNAKKDESKKEFDFAHHKRDGALETFGRVGGMVGDQATTKGMPQRECAINARC